MGRGAYWLLPDFPSFYFPLSPFPFSCLAYAVKSQVISWLEALMDVMPSLRGLYPWDSLVEAQAATADARYELPGAFRLAAAQCF